MNCVGRKISIILSFFFVTASSLAQDQFFKIKVGKEGIYQITDIQAKQIGAGSISEISIFGYPGMLPQKLDSTHLYLQEIAAKEENGKLFFYINTPYSSGYDENGSAFFTANQFTDSISFLISKKQNPKRIKSEKAISSAQPSSIAYQWFWLKEEENNILSSGRTWYSRALSPGLTRGYNFPLQSNINAPWKITGIVMASSLSPATISLATESQLLSDLPIDPILNTTYGIKGREVSINQDFLPSGNRIERLRISFQSTDPSASGYFNYIGIGVPYSSQNLPAGIFEYPILKTTSTTIQTGLKAWELSDFFNPIEFDFSSGNTVSIKKMIVFDASKAMEIKKIESITTQLRSINSWPELLIIAPSIFKNSAEKLRMHKLAMGVFAEVALVPEIFDAFGYGNPDLNAIRNFIAWHYQKGGKLKNVLILGKGTFDYKGKLGGRPNLVPIYTSRNSLNPLSTFSSDDYYGLLDWGSGTWEESREGDEIMKIGVGRLPVINGAEASIVVNKIIDYELNQKPGDWKKTIALVADDGDNNIHLRDTEVHATSLSNQNQTFKLEKIYLDRFAQEKTGTRQTAIEAKKALEEQLQKGALFLNYVGHGNETTLTAEEIFTVSDIQNWSKQEKLALWVTATCEFGRHDSPFFRSAAEELLIADKKGAIGLLSTGRPVFSSVNFTLNEAFIETVLKEAQGNYQDLGTIFKNTKNGSLNGALNRNFSLLGDPSMRLAIPEYNINFTAIKDADSKVGIDTLKGYQRIEFEAEVVDKQNQARVQNFTGSYSIVLSDKPKLIKTLGDESSPTEFKEESILLFKGTGAINEGLLKGELILPKNTNPDFGNGNLRIIGKREIDSSEAYGNFIPIIGGKIAASPSDKVGPEIKAKFGFGDENKFVFPSTVIPLVAEFKDESGINISNIDPLELMRIQINEQEELDIHTIYLARNNSFKEGSVNLELKGLKEGKNVVRIKVWDTLGNGSELVQEITVEGSETLKILNHKTFPNPTSIESKFSIEHNRPGENILIDLSVYQTDGKILFSNSQRLVKAEAIINNLSWVFYQNQTKYPAKGTYIYKLTLQSEQDNSFDSVSGKIVIQ